MANEKINLASLNIDIQGLLQAAATSKTEIDKIKAALGELKAAGLSTSESFKNLETQLAALTAILQTQEQAIAKLESKNKDLGKQLDKTSKKVKDSGKDLNSFGKNVKKVTDEINDLEDELKDVTGEFEELSENAEDATDAIDELTSSLNENKKATEDGGSASEKLKSSFKESNKLFKDSFNQINIFNGGLKGFGKRMEAVGGFKPLVVGALKGMTTGVKGMGQAIASNPIGILLQILGPIITKLMEFTPVTKAVEKAMAGLAPIIEIVTMPLQLLAEGLAWVVGGLTDLLGAMSSSADEAIKLKEAQEELAAATELQGAANQKAKLQIDELIKKSKDHTLSEEERVKAIEEATKVQRKNYQERADLANKTLDVEKQKLIQAKGLSEQDIKIIEEGDSARVQSLMERTDLTTEEIEAYNNALIEKKRIAAEESTIKQQQLDNFKNITDELIKKSQDQTLSEEKRLEAVENVAALNTEFFEKRKGENDEELRQAIEKMDKFSILSDEEINKIIELGDEYEKKEQLIQFLSEEEKKQLQKILDEKKRINNEEVESIKATSDAKQAVYDSEAAERDKNAAKAKKKQDDANKEYAKRLQLELKLYMQAQSQKEMSAEEELAYLKEVERQKTAIAKAEFQTTKKTKNDQLALTYKLNQIELDSKKEQADVAIANANKELKNYIAAHQTKITAETKLTEAIVAEENKRLENIKNQQLQILALEKGTDDQIIADKQARNEALTEADIQYLEQKKAIEDEYQIKTEENNTALEEQTKAKETAKHEEELQKKLEQAATEYEEQEIIENDRHTQEVEKLNEQRNQGLITEQEYNQLYEAETQRHEKANAEIKKAAFNNKVELAKSAYTNMATILGKESEAGKAMAIAQATIDTYKSAVSAYGAMSGIPVIGPALGAVAAGAAVVAGVKNVKKISSTKPAKAPKAEKGALFNIGGKRHSQGGTTFTGEDGTRFEAEQGELIGVMNRNAASHFMAFNNAFPAGGGSASSSNYFESGGIVSRSIATPGVNTDELAAKIAEANQSLPAPRVAVEDIVTEGDSYVQVREGANF